jgi:hypothetical protein
MPWSPFPGLSFMKLGIDGFIAIPNGMMIIMSTFYGW